MMTTLSSTNHIDHDDLIASIHAIAKENMALKDSSTSKPYQITRRKLVERLNEIHPEIFLADTAEVNDLVKRAYNLGNDDEKKAILFTIKENLGSSPVYDPKRIQPDFDVSNFEVETKNLLIRNTETLLLNSGQVQSESAKFQIKAILDKTINLKFEKELFGIGNAKKAKKYAKNVLKGYGKMIEEYDTIKNIILSLLTDFDLLRNQLKNEREDVIQFLIDLFGDRVKQEYPELFDIDKVEYLQFDELWEKINLYYLEIETYHNEFTQAVDYAIDSFKNTVSSEASLAFRSLENKKNLNEKDVIGAATGFIINSGISGIKGLIHTRNKSKEVVALITREAEIIKQKMKDDQELIISDIFRLGGLYSKMVHSILPNYQSYIKSNSDIIARELKPLYDKVLSNPLISSKKKQNNELIRKRRELEYKLMDLDRSYKFSLNEEDRLGKILDDRKMEYDIARSLKPNPPNFLIDIFTFGRSSSIYHKNYQVWISYCKPTVDDYLYLSKLYENEAINQNEIKSFIRQLKDQVETISFEIENNSREIFEEFHKRENSELELRTLVTIIKKIVNASRNVLEVELDESLQKVTGSSNAPAIQNSSIETVDSLEPSTNRGNNVVENFVKLGSNVLESVHEQSAKGLQEIHNVNEQVSKSGSTVSEILNKYYAKVDEFSNTMEGKGIANDKIQNFTDKITSKVDMVAGGNERLQRFFQEKEMIMHDQLRKIELAKNVLFAFQEFESEYENGMFHRFSSKLEQGLLVALNDPKTEEMILSKIEKRLGAFPAFVKIDSHSAGRFTRELAVMGLESLKTQIKVMNLNQETKALKKINAISEKELVSKIEENFIELKKQIELNKENHKKVGEALKDNSLSGLEQASQLINENAKNYNESLDQDVQDFMDGGDLKI